MPRTSSQLHCAISMSDELNEITGTPHVAVYGYFVLKMVVKWFTFEGDVNALIAKHSTLWLPPSGCRQFLAQMKFSCCWNCSRRISNYINLSIFYQNTKWMSDVHISLVNSCQLWYCFFENGLFYIKKVLSINWRQENNSKWRRIAKKKLFKLFTSAASLTVLWKLETPLAEIDFYSLRRPNMLCCLLNWSFKYLDL